MNVTDRPARILIVEDDNTSAFLLKRQLDKAGYEVFLAPEVEEAWRLLKQWPFDLILSDLVLPGTSGLDFCRKLRTGPDTQGIPIILVSARDEVEAIVEGLDAGADDYVAKPFNPEELLARVRTQLRIRSLQQRLLNAEQDRVVAELAGAAAHEINQPLTILMGYAEMVMPLVEGDESLEEKLKRIYQSAEEIADVVRRIQELRSYKTKKYVDELHILDLGSSEKGFRS